MDIFAAVKAGDCNLIANHVSQIRCVDQDGNTALMVAAKKGSLGSIKVLLANKVDVNTVNKDMDTALSLAIKYGSFTCTRALVEAGASLVPHNMRVEAPLLVATKAGLLDIVTLLLDRGADVNAGEKEEYTPLIVAAGDGSAGIARRLLQKGANVDLCTTDGQTALITAAANGNDEMVLLLLRYGADVNHCTTEKRVTALRWASAKCSYATVKALLDAGASTDHKNANGSTALDFARDPLMLRLLRAYQFGPSWLVQELSTRGLKWEQVCHTEDKLLAAGLCTKKNVLAIPPGRWNDAYLKTLGITDPLVCRVMHELRLQSTWLGTRLAACGVGVAWLGVCEVAVFDTVGSATEASFAQVLPDELSDECLSEMGIVSGFVCRAVRSVHAQVVREVSGESAAKRPRR